MIAIVFFLNCMSAKNYARLSLMEIDAFSLRV